MHLQVATVFLLVFIALSRGETLSIYTFELRPNIDVDWTTFYSNVTIEVNFDSKNETICTGHLPIRSFEITPLEADLSEQIDQLKSIRFKYSSENNPKDIFSMDRLMIGQKSFGNRDFYFRSFTLDAPLWLMQDVWYEGHPSTH